MDAVTLAQEQAAMRDREAATIAPAPEPIKPTIIDEVIAASEDTDRVPAKRSTDVEIYIRNGVYWLYDRLTRRRFTARTKERETAKREAQRIMDSRDPVKRRLAELERKAKHETILIVDAIKKYIDDECAIQRELGLETIEAYECAVTQMKDYCHSRSIYALSDITGTILKDWRTVWPDKKKSSKNKKQRQIKTFFKWVCEQQHWLEIDNNPALALTTIKGEHTVAAVPFYEDQYNAILDATYVYEDSNRFRDAAMRLRALIQLMRWSGLAIRDALTLPRWAINEHTGILKTTRIKTNTAVKIALPMEVVKVLFALQNDNPEYFFYNGTSKPRSVVGDYNRMLRRLFKLVKWPRPVVDGKNRAITPHSHMLRHTFAYHWLNSINPATGLLGDIRDLQLLLGHKRLATTERHYSAFMPDEADRLVAEQRARHASQNAPGVPKIPVQAEPEHHIRVRVRQRAHRR